MSSFKEFVLKMLLGLIGNFDGYVADAQMLLTENLFSGAIYDSMIMISGYLRPVCLTIISFCFLIEFLKLTMTVDMLKWEFAFKVFAKLCIAQVAIDVAPHALAAIYSIAAGWINKVGSSGVGSGMGVVASDALYILFEDLSFWSSLGLLATLGIMFIVVLICGIVIKVIAFARMFEIFVYIAVSPIPCAFLPLSDSGHSRITKRYFLGFAAVCLQGLMMIIVMKIFDAIVGQTIADAIAANVETGAAGVAAVCYNMLLGALVLTIAVTKSGSWAKQILDAA